MFLRSLTTIACTAILTTAVYAQSTPMPGDMKMDKPAAKSDKPLPSPAATANTTLDGKAVTVNYNSPRVRGRKIMGGLVPYGQVWRTGANPATTLITAGNLKIGTLTVPAGTYTIYTLPNADHWLLIVNKQTGQWGTEYDESKDLGRTPLTSATLPSPQENMTISFENTKGNATELHIKWDKADESVPVTAE
jgi:hypothetical protein